MPLLYLRTRMPPPADSAEEGPVRRVIAVHGKVLRGSRIRAATAIQLLALDHPGVVLTQRQVTFESNETPSFAPLPDDLELENTVVTADALRTQNDYGAYLTSRGAHCVAVVKKNHPDLYAHVRLLHGGTSRSGTALATTPATATRSAGSRSPRSAKPPVSRDEPGQISITQ
jgi:hypothetical protein